MGHIETTYGNSRLHLFEKDGWKPAGLPTIVKRENGLYSEDLELAIEKVNGPEFDYGACAIYSVDEIKEENYIIIVPLRKL